MRQRQGSAAGPGERLAFDLDFDFDLDFAETLQPPLAPQFRVLTLTWLLTLKLLTLKLLT
jgi:hypothetical protein